MACAGLGNNPLLRSYADLYCALVKLNWKVVLAVFSAALALAGSGCSGVHAQGSVSPATFLLPGLMRNDAQPADPTAPLPLPAPEVQVAQVR